MCCDSTCTDGFLINISSQSNLVQNSQSLKKPDGSLTKTCSGTRRHKTVANTVIHFTTKALVCKKFTNFLFFFSLMTSFWIEFKIVIINVQLQQCKFKLSVYNYYRQRKLNIIPSTRTSAIFIDTTKSNNFQRDSQFSITVRRRCRLNSRRVQHLKQN